MLSAFLATVPAFSSHGADLAAASIPGTQLSISPPIHLYEGFLSRDVVKHFRSKVPAEESVWEPCVGQKSEFASKRCTLIPVEGDNVLEGVLSQIETAWDIDVAALRKGLPVIRYLPGAPPVGLHGDMGHDGLVPNSTLVLYLTDADIAADGTPSGQTIFPDVKVTVAPHAGSILAFQNVDAIGAPHPQAKHSVGAVPRDAKSDRLVIQVPILYAAVGKRPFAYPEHVSGPGKAPGQHEAMHGTDAQKAAYAAAIAAGATLAAAYAAALAGKFEGGEEAPKEEEKKD